MLVHYGVSAAKIYLYVSVYHSSKNTSSRPPLGKRSEYNSVQSFSGSWLEIPAWSGMKEKTVYYVLVPFCKLEDQWKILGQNF